MGNCCSGEQAQAGKDIELNMQRDIKQGGGYIASKNHQKKQVKNGGQLTNEDILRMIVKIQAVFRGVLVRKQIQQIYGYSARERGMMGGM